MPTPILDCHQTWAIAQKNQWNRSGLTTKAEDESMNISIGASKFKIQYNPLQSNIQYSKYIHRRPLFNLYKRTRFINPTR